MIKISEQTRQELEQGYQICPCGDGVHLLQAGFEVPLYHCKKCEKMMARNEEFFNVPVEVFSK